MNLPERITFDRERKRVNGEETGRSGCARQGQPSRAQLGGRRHSMACGSTSMRKWRPLSGSPSRLKVISCGASISSHGSAALRMLLLSSSLNRAATSAGSSSSAISRRSCSRPSLISALGHSSAAAGLLAVADADHQRLAGPAEVRPRISQRSACSVSMRSKPCTK